MSSADEGDVRVIPVRVPWVASDITDDGNVIKTWLDDFVKSYEASGRRQSKGRAQKSIGDRPSVLAVPCVLGPDPCSWQFSGHRSLPMSSLAHGPWQLFIAGGRGWTGRWLGFWVRWVVRFAIPAVAVRGSFLVVDESRRVVSSDA